MVGLFCYLCVHLLANIGPEGFAPFLNKYFVETGTLNGSGVQKALDAGFSEVRSIEHDEKKYRSCVEKFKAVEQVKLFHGNSSQDLWLLIQDIQEPATFWLDAHIFPPRRVRNCPLLEELEQIKQHPIKTHTILIDDMHCSGTRAFDYLTREDLMRKIWEINPLYTITFINGGDQGEYPANIMVAIPRVIQNLEFFEIGARDLH